MHGGGIADKVGNRYEALWLIRQLTDLLDGAALSVIIEPLGVEGVEFCVERPTGREWHQCKRQTSATWTINRLATEGVLENFKKRIDHSSDDRCLFVSTDPARHLKHLKEKVSGSLDPEAFAKTLSGEEQTQWQRLQNLLALDAVRTLDWLNRCDFKGIDEYELEAIVLATLARWFDAPPATVLATLRRWIESDENFNRTLRQSELVAACAAREISVKRYEIDGTVQGKLAAANENYVGSYRPIGAGLFDIDRAEVDQLLNALNDPSGPRRIALAGPAGSGKSVIVRKTLERLALAGTVLVVRVDQIANIATLADMGATTIQIADSPAIVLERLAGDSSAILIVDQADAVSEMSGRATAMRSVLLDLLRQASHYRHVRVVFSCRSFDIDNDHAFRSLVDPKFCTRIDVGTLRWAEDVCPVLSALNIGVGTASPKLQALLCQPIGLAIAAELARDAPIDLAHVDHLSQLYAELLERRDREIRNRDAPPWSLFDVLTTIAKTMSDRETLAVPMAILDRFAGAKDMLQHAGLIVANGAKISFMHESLVDYLHARAFVTDGTDLPSFLLASEQTLFRRTQVRQILAQQRDLDRSAYLTGLRFILQDVRVRPHVRDLVMRWLAMLPDPSRAEWEIVSDGILRSGVLPRQLGSLLFGSKGWVLLLDQLDILAEWLKAEDDDDLFWVLRAVERIAGSAGSEVVRILTDFLNQRPDKAGMVLRCFSWFQPEGPMPELSDLIVRCLDLCGSLGTPDNNEGPLTAADGWIKKAPDDAGKIYGALFSNWYRLHAEGTPFNDDGGTFGRLDFYHFNELAQARPDVALSCVLPAMRTAMERAEIGDDPPLNDRIWHWRRKDRGDGPHVVQFINIVRNALKRVAVEAVNRVPNLLASLDPGRHVTALHLVLETVAANADLAPLLVEQIDNPKLFDAGWYHADAFSAGAAMATAWPCLDLGERGRLEARVLGYYPELKVALRYWKFSQEPEKEGNFNPEQYRCWCKGCLFEAGKTQWSTLGQLRDVELSPIARGRLAELDRKFVGVEPDAPDGIRGGTVRSPIPSARAKKMNDRAWLKAMTTNWSGVRTWRGDGMVGDASDLARVLYEEVKLDRERFTQLLWQIPKEAPACFARSVLEAMSEATISSDELDTLLRRLEAESPWAPDDHIILRLIGSAGDADLGDFAFARLVAIARSGESKTGASINHGTRDKPEPLFQQAMRNAQDLEWRGLQTPRGRAVQKLGYRAWNRKEIFDHVRPVVDALLAENVEAEVLATLGVMLQAAVKHDLPCASEWLGRLGSTCPMALMTQAGRGALFRFDILNHDQAAPQLIALLHNDDKLVSALTAALIVARSFEDDYWIATRTEVMAGDAEWRAAAAQVAVEQVEPKLRAPELNAFIVRFFNDEVDLVRTTAADVFRRLDTSAMALHADLYRGFLESAAYVGERTYFLHRLEEAPAELDGLVLELLELTAAKMTKPEARRGSAGYRLWEPLTRIYHSNEGNQELRKRCLDVIDTLISADISGSDKLHEAVA